MLKNSSKRNQKSIEKLKYTQLIVITTFSNFHKFGLFMYPYFSGINDLVISAIRFAWKGELWDQVEVLTGKSMSPAPGMQKTILLGKCIYRAHQDSPHIQGDDPGERVFSQAPGYAQSPPQSRYRTGSGTV
jgi:hypothetical protein